MKKLRFSLIIVMLLASVIVNTTLAGASGPEAISLFSISPSPVYPGNPITFDIEWTGGATGLSVGDGHALCIYYSVNFNNTIGLTSDGFTAAGNVYSIIGDTYVKEGPSSLGGSTTNCPISPGSYVVGYVKTEASGGITEVQDILMITIIVPREAATTTVYLRQRRYPDGGSSWTGIDLRFTSVTINPAANSVYAGSQVQCGSNQPCYDTIQQGINYVASGGVVNVMGAFIENVDTRGRSLTLQRGSAGASITANANNAITVAGGTVVIRDLAITADEPAVAINVGGGMVTVKGCTIDANAGTAFGCGGGTLSAYANNFTNVVAATSGTGCTASLKHNYWGTYDGSGPVGLGNAWNARLGNMVASYADGYINAPGGVVTLNGATMGGGMGTAVIVSHGKNYPPFGNGIAEYIYSMCGEYYDFFVRGGSGNWNLVLPVDNNIACNANVRDLGALYKISNIADCGSATNPACWDRVTTGVSIVGQSLQVSGLSASELEGTQYVVGSSDGSDPTAIQLRNLTASSTRNVWLPLAFLLIALGFGCGGLILARQRR
jgi:hypothetical protein